MTARRRPKGSAPKDAKVVGFVISERISKRISEIAEDTGISRSELIEHLIEHADLDQFGAPRTFEPRHTNLELPISA